AAAYGANVGMAFQLADDIIDVTSTSETSGKVRGTDLKERVPTLPILLLRQGGADGGQEAKRVLELVDGPLDTEEQEDAAVTAVANHSVIDTAWKMTTQWTDQAIAALNGLIDARVRTAVVESAESGVSRDA